MDVQLFDPWSEIGGLEWLEVVFVVLEYQSGMSEIFEMWTCSIYTIQKEQMYS